MTKQNFFAIIIIERKIKGEKGMAKVSFSSLKLKVKEDIEEIYIGDKKVEVKTYISTEELNDMIQAVVEQATTSTIYNDFLGNCILADYIVMTYTNLSFTDTQKSDLLKLYDILKTNNVIDAVFDAIGSDGKNRILIAYDKIITEYKKYTYSVKGLTDQILQFAPKSASEITEQLKNFDVEKYSQIMEMAQGTSIQFERS